jgi:tRNA U55 pseudouridine synthase TruB
MGPPTTALPRGDDVERVLPRFRGTFDQVPPRHSAKKVAGRRAYDLARAQQPVTLKPVSVTVRALDLIDWAAPNLLRLRVTASSGFYVRALARDLGEAAGCGAHLAALRRIWVGSFGVDAALPLDEAERLGREVASRLIPPAEALPDLPAVRVTDDGLKRVLHGNPIGPEGCVSVPSFIAASAAAPPLAVAPALEDPLSSSRLRAAVRLLAPDGRLVALAEPRQGFLHPVVVLGYH